VKVHRHLESLVDYSVCVELLSSTENGTVISKFIDHLSIPRCVHRTT